MNKRITGDIDLAVEPIRMALPFEKAAEEANRRNGRRMLRNNAIAALAGVTALATALFVLHENEPKMASVAHVSQGLNNAGLN